MFIYGMNTFVRLSGDYTSVQTIVKAGEPKRAVIKPPIVGNATVIQPATQALEPKSGKFYLLFNVR